MSNAPVLQIPDISQRMQLQRMQEEYERKQEAQRQLERAIAKIKEALAVYYMEPFLENLAHHAHAVIGKADMGPLQPPELIAALHEVFVNDAPLVLSRLIEAAKPQSKVAAAEEAPK